jgi:hypothetical protein
MSLKEGSRMRCRRREFESAFLKDASDGGFK